MLIPSVLLSEAVTPVGVESFAGGEAVPVAVAEAVLYPETDLVTMTEVVVLGPRPVTVTCPVEEFTVPVPEDKEYVAPVCVPEFIEAVQPPDCEVAVPYENATASAKAEVI